MPNEIEIRISGSNYTKGVLEQPRQDMKKLGDQSKETAKDLVLQAAAGRMLESQMKDLQKESKQLAYDLTYVSSAADKIKLEEKLKVNQSVMADLKKLKNILGEAGTEGGKQFSKGFGDVLSALPSQVKGVAIITGVVIGAALAPGILSAVGAAVLGGVGTGGIIGGIALASQDSRVKQAGEALKDSFLTAFEPIGAQFVGPAVRALEQFQGTGAKLADTIGPSMEKLARISDRLAGNLSDAVDLLGPGLAKGIDASIPVLRAAGDEIEEIAEAAGDFIEFISEDTDGAILALESISEVLQSQLRLWGATIGGAEETYEWMVRTGNVTLRIMEMHAGWVPILGEILEKSREGNDELLEGLEKAKDGSEDYTGALEEQIKKTEEEAAAVKALSDSFNDLFGIQMSIDEATDNYAGSLDRLKEAFKGSNDTLKNSTELGRDHREAVRDEISGIEDLRNANINNGMSVAAADAKYQAQLNTLEKNLIKLGANKNEVKALIDAYRNVPKNVSTTVSAPGLAATLARMRELDRLFYNSPAFSSYRAGERDASGKAHGGAVSSAASGGNRGGLVTMNERGGELVQMPDGSVVIPHGQSTQMLYNMMGNGGGGGGSLRLEAYFARTTGNALIDAIIDDLRLKIDTEGQGDVQSYLGRSS